MVQGKLWEYHRIVPCGGCTKISVLNFTYSGLRLNEDLTRGSTSKSVGFDNEELIAEGEEVFEVGLGMWIQLFFRADLSLAFLTRVFQLFSYPVEVYRFIREVDNKPVCFDWLIV